MNLLTPELCRAARGLLAWGQRELAQRANVAHATIAEFELGTRRPYGRTLRDIAAAFEAGGIIFIEEKTGVHATGIAFKWGCDPVSLSKTQENETDGNTDENLSAHAWKEDFETIDNDGTLEEDRALLRLYYEEYPDRWDKLSPLGKACLARTMRL